MAIKVDQNFRDNIGLGKRQKKISDLDCVWGQ